ASAAMVLLLSLYIPAYSAIASRVDRMRLITWVTAFFIGCLGAFYLLARAHMPHLGLVFFIWVGIFNVSIIAQFWSYANDVYTPEAGKRLFAIVAFGSTMGAIAGATITKALIAPLGVKQRMLVAAGFQLTVNVVAAVVQLFLVSRILRWFGVRAALFFMPLISLAGYSMLAIAPIIGTIRLVKIAENSTDYSLQNTTRQALFLPTSR